MSETRSEIRDWLVALTAEIDQAQAAIDEARLLIPIIPNSSDYQKQLDEKQFLLDVQRKRVKILMFCNDTIPD